MKILLFILLLSVSVFAQNTDLSKVYWLTGCWGGEMKSGHYEECWSSPTKTFMQGAGAMVKKDGKVTMREHMTLEIEGGEIVMYILGYGEKLKPEEQGTIPFKLVKSNKTELFFENPTHDYPQRIVYSKRKDGNLSCRIELLDGKQPLIFPLKTLAKQQNNGH